MRPPVRTAFAVLFLCIILTSTLSGQTTFLLNHVPASTPTGDSLFVAGSFNDWNPHDEAYRLYRRQDGEYSLTAATLTPPFEYKFTRGSWETGEADELGKPVGNRIQQTGGSPLTIACTVTGWEDMPGQSPKSVLHILITSIPDNTPKDASLYITGNFNSWQPGDQKFALQSGPDDSWYVDIPMYTDSIEYKFCRGSWTSVEGRKSGRARFNRMYLHDGSSSPGISVRIDSWEDLAGTAINVYTVFWLMAAIQGLLLIIAIMTIERPVRVANKLLSVLLLLFSIALVARVVVYDREVFQLLPKLLLIPDFLYFLYAPIFLMYIQRLLRSTAISWSWQRWIIFLPFLIHLGVYFPLWMMDNETFIYKAVDRSLAGYFEVIGGVALIYNLFYWVYARRIINTYQYESDHEFSSGSNLTFLNTIMLLKAICLLIWAGTYVTGGIGSISDTEVTFFTDRLTDALWIGFSLTIFLLGYFALRQPDIFRLPDQQVSSEPIAPIVTAEIKQVESDLDIRLKTKLEKIMLEETPYVNPKLTLSDLASSIGTNTHELSRVINQGFGKNFNDFVNSYRVHDFQEKMSDKSFSNHTFLAVAFMVGFNSKTAFNRSFKKLTGQTPGEFFKNQGADS